MLLAIAAGGVWWFWPTDASPKIAQADDDADNATKTEPSAGLTDATGPAEPLPWPDEARDDAATSSRKASSSPDRDDREDERIVESDIAADPPAPLSVIRMDEASPSSAEENTTDDQQQSAASQASADGQSESAPSVSDDLGPIQALVAQARAALDQNQPLLARRLLNRALHDVRAGAAQRARIRQRLSGLNERLVFSPLVIEGDPIASRYIVQPGDTLSKIAVEQNLQIDWRLLLRINDISDPRRLRAGQTIKLVRGPFDAMIDKSEHRLDLYARLSDSADAEPQHRLFIRSFNVGLGKYQSTPPGLWVVREDSKLINPPWTNPRTGEYYSADNPENPIGERWIGLQGIDEKTRQMSGYGLHGTIEPESIGQNVSMGCVRLSPDGVAILYEMLSEGVSRVRIVDQTS